MFVKASGESSVIEAASCELQDRGIDLSKPGYRRGWKLLAQAGEGMGLEVRSTEIFHWASTLGILRAVDGLVDHDGAESISDEVELLSQGRTIDGVTGEEAALFAEVMASYGPLRRQRQREDICSLPYFARQRLAASSTRQLTDVNRFEARRFARLLKLDISSAATDEDQLEPRQRFNGWVEKISSVSYLLDSCFDMGEDYSAGNVQVKPSVFSRGVIMKRALPELVSAAKITPLNSIGAIAVTAFKMNVLERAA